MTPIPRQRDYGSAGTAGAGYRTVPPPHDDQPETPEYGRRPHCTVCGREHAKETAR